MFHPSHKCSFSPFSKRTRGAGARQSHTGCLGPRFFVHPSLKHGTEPQPCARDGRSNPVLQSCPLQVAPAGATSRLSDAHGKVTAARSPPPRPGLPSRRLCIPATRPAGRPRSPAAGRQRGAAATHVSSCPGGARTPAPGEERDRERESCEPGREQQAVSARLSGKLPQNAPRAPAQLPGLITVSDRQPLLPIKRHKDDTIGGLRSPPRSTAGTLPRPQRCRRCRDCAGTDQARFKCQP